ncbi:MAG: hypothetical protein LBJ65_03345 [Burkholderia sp.]|uniref:hypothetical protein n=1 Tax=Burkholderia sp. TaxID=36773 RepID=UPI002826516F|nr:hypothetical protein [Burkholderia sp.]MDR0240617.1 hypothetical protein [Burkholderia sp.]
MRTLRIVSRSGRGPSACAASIRASSAPNSIASPASGANTPASGRKRIASHSFTLRRQVCGRHSNPPAANASPRGITNRRLTTSGFGAGQAGRRARVIGQAGCDGAGNLPTNVFDRRSCPGIAQTAVRRGTQQIMLRRRSKTVESCRAAAPNRDNPHFGDA